MNSATIITLRPRFTPSPAFTQAYRVHRVLEVVAECDDCSAAYTLGQFEALPAAGVLSLADGTDFVASRWCRCGGVVSR